VRAPSVDLAALLAELEANPEQAARFARTLAPHIFAVAMCAAKRPQGTYSSRKGCGAPGYSDERWKSVARQIGVKRGRWHFVTAEELSAYEAGQAPKAIAENAALPERWDPLANIEDARARRARRAQGGR